MSDSFDIPVLLDRQGRSYDIVGRVQKTWREMHDGRQPGFEVELIAATQLGLCRVAAVFPQGPDVIIISVYGHSEGGEIVFAPVEQCSFSIRHFRPTPDKPRVVVGFAPPKDESNAVS